MWARGQYLECARPDSPKTWWLGTPTPWWVGTPTLPLTPGGWVPLPYPYPPAGGYPCVIPSNGDLFGQPTPHQLPSVVPVLLRRAPFTLWDRKGGGTGQAWPRMTRNGPEPP